MLFVLIKRSSRELWHTTLIRQKGLFVNIDQDAEFSQERESLIKRQDSGRCRPKDLSAAQHQIILGLEKVHRHQCCGAYSYCCQAMLLFHDIKTCDAITNFVILSQICGCPNNRTLHHLLLYV